MSNKDDKVIEEFGNEWLDFNFSEPNTEKLKEIFDDYFYIFPWELISNESIGFDMGCGSGRWDQFIAPKVKHLNCIEPSHAIDVARKNLSLFNNISFFKETSDSCSLESNSQDFGYSLGVLHHIPDTEAALGDCARLLKSGAPLLLYLYYSFDNKPLWFRVLWKLSDYLRKMVSSFPKPAKRAACNVIAYTVYFPLSRGAFVLEKLGLNVDNIPLSIYRNKPFYYCKNDALDRFGTRLEQRFSKTQIEAMLERKGFESVKFSPNMPYWCCVALKK